MLFAIAKYGAAWNPTRDDKEHCECVCDMDVFLELLLEFMSAPSNNKRSQRWEWMGCAALEKSACIKNEAEEIDECGFSASSSSLLVVNQKFSHCLCYVLILCAHSMESLCFRLYNKIIYEGGRSSSLEHETDDPNLESLLNDFWQFILWLIWFIAYKMCSYLEFFSSPCIRM